MALRTIFAGDVTRDIAPVVYFHDQTPAKLQTEVEEYIITGGYPPGDPRRKRVESGIHEQFVRLLTAIRVELERPEGTGLPTCWISGFYGSGKSIFAKLLALALDGRVLADETPLATALQRRDDSPLAHEFREAWQALVTRVGPSLAVAFDIGSVARDDEHIHSAVVRKVQERLGYCAKSSLVADHELKLEIDGEWEAFLAAAERVLGRPWAQAKDAAQADDHFSHALHALRPDRYPTPVDWIDSHAGAGTRGRSVGEAVAAIEDMLDARAPGQALFVVVDEVSQYVHGSDDRMLKLQSFASELGSRLKGRVWLLVTGQEKLDDTSSVIHKLKDRFREHLRVHLASANIRDVVHRRLLKKKPEHEPEVRELFRRHRHEIEVHAYGCRGGITEEDFVETYPLLPGQIDLILRITSAVRRSSTRVQGDQYAIRGLLQLVGALFRERGLAERDFGTLVTLDLVFDAQRTALDSDVQRTMDRILEHCANESDPLAARAAKAVALLQYIQESEPTSEELVASCLYDTVGAAAPLPAVTEALQRLRAANFLGYSEKQGYKIQSTAGEEWNRERDDIGITPEQIAELVRDQLKTLVSIPDRPRYKGQSFAWLGWFGDGQYLHDARLDKTADEAVVYLDFRFLRAQERQAAAWIRASAEGPLADRVLWLAGRTDPVRATARELRRSQRMIERYLPRRESLSRDKLRLLLDEQTREEDLNGQLRRLVDDAWMEGQIFFRGRPLVPRDLGGTFATTLFAVGNQVLPTLYPEFTGTAVSDKELGQLLEKTLTGPSGKFLDGDLGILTLDAGRYVAACAGTVPSRILRFIEERKGADGATLFQHFGRPPYGYPSDVVRACLAGLLRAGKIRVQPEKGAAVTSVNDPDVKPLFLGDRAIRRAEIFPDGGIGPTPRDRIAICKMFKEYLDIEVERENDAIADAVYAQFPGQRERLRHVEERLNRIPGRPALPLPLDRLAKALEACRRSRQIEDTVVAVKAQLEALGDGFQLLGIFEAELTSAAIERVQRAGRVARHALAQLVEYGASAEVLEAGRALTEQLERERPWRDIATLDGALDTIEGAYRAARTHLLATHEAQAHAARERLKAHDGFADLDADAAHRVLRPITEAQFDTTAEAVSPTLTELRDRFPTRLARAEEQANGALDEELEGIIERKTAKVPASLRGRVITDRAELRAVLRELEEKIGPALDEGRRVRIV